MRTIVLASLIACLLGSKLHANKGLFTFRIVASSGDQAVIEPVLPAHFQVTRIKGESQLTTIVQCVIIPSVKENEPLVKILKCGNTEYVITGIVLQR